jgi:hypothetical protein
MGSPLQAASLKPGMESDDYNMALQQIKEALNARTSKPFNPTLMAMAQGFLTPTATGSFGESLGQVAKSVLSSQEQQQKEAMDVGQMRLQIAQAEREQARKTKGMQFLEDRGKPTGAAPTGATSAGDASGPAVQTSQGMLTPAEIARIMYSDQELGKALEAEYKMNMEAIAVQPSGAYNKITNKYTPFGGKTTVQRFVPADPSTGRKPMNIDMSEDDAILFDQARSKGDGKTLNSLINRYTQFPSELPPEDTSVQIKPLPLPKPFVGSAQSNVAPNVAQANQAQTPQELKNQQELDLAQQKAEAEALSKARADRTNAKIAAGDDASSRRQTSQVIQDLFKQEGMDQVTGVLEKPGFLSGVMKLAEEGINLGQGFNISVPQIRDIFTANKISLPKVAGETRQQYDKRVEDVISRTQQALSLFAQVTFGMRSLAKGQGAISNFEQVIFDRMGPTVRDNFATVMAKTRHMEERANFDEAIKGALVDSGTSFDKFSRSDEYKDMVQKYDNKIRSIYTNVLPDTAPAKSDSQATTAKPSGSSKAKSSSDAKTRLEEALK